jgi:hypothetical protein
MHTQGRPRLEALRAAFAGSPFPLLEIRALESLPGMTHVKGELRFWNR